MPRRKIKKTVYLLTIAASLFLGSITGFTSPDFPSSFYAQPYGTEFFNLSLGISGAEKFTDMTSNDWYFSYVDALVKKEIVNGVSQTQYNPNGTLTLPECAALLVRSLGLEQEASSRQQLISAKGKQGSDKWYIGYIELLCNMKVIDGESYGYTYDKQGDFIEKASEPSLRPIKRYELALFLSNITKLDSSPVRAKNTYSERGGYGYEFIRGGMYDESAVLKYKEEISDFESIPQEYRQSVLECYYNAIFNGDSNGNFNPESSLTRAEMAKIIATLDDISLRFGKDLRENAILPDKSDYTTDIYGNKVLKKDIGRELLESSIKEISMNNGYVRLSHNCVLPLGYTLEANIYTADADGACTKVMSYGNMQSGSNVPYEIHDYYIGDNGVVIYILRNVAAGGDIEGILEVSIKNGSITYGDAIARSFA